MVKKSQPYLLSVFKRLPKTHFIFEAYTNQQELNLHLTCIGAVGVVRGWTSVGADGGAKRPRPVKVVHRVLTKPT